MISQVVWYIRIDGRNRLIFALCVRQEHLVARLSRDKSTAWRLHSDFCYKDVQYGGEQRTRTSVTSGFIVIGLFAWICKWLMNVAWPVHYKLTNSKLSAASADKVPMMHCVLSIEDSDMFYWLRNLKFKVPITAKQWKKILFWVTAPCSPLPLRWRFLKRRVCSLWGEVRGSHGFSSGTMVLESGHLSVV